MPQRVTVGARKQRDGIQDSQPTNNSGMISTNTSRWVMSWLEFCSYETAPAENVPGNLSQHDHDAQALRGDGRRRSAPATSRIARLQ